MSPEARAIFAPVEDAIAAVGRGEIVVVVDDEDRENEGDLIMTAEAATPETIGFFVRHTSGVICTPILGERLDELDLPLMVAANTAPYRTAFTVSVDARTGTTTGISAADRAITINALIDLLAGPDDFNRPGHIFPLRYREGGVLKRAGHTEAAVDLARLAGLDPSGILCEIVNDDGTMARGPQLERFAAEHGLVLVSIADLVRHRRERIRSAMEISGSPWVAANRSSWGRRAISPLSSTISHSTAAGARPARRARSTAASVWPARLRTPPSR